MIFLQCIFLITIGSKFPGNWSLLLLLKMQDSTGLIDLPTNPNICTNSIKYTTSTTKFSPWQLSTFILSTMLSETWYLQLYRLFFWGEELIALCFSFGRFGRYSWAQKDIADMSFRGVQREFFSSYQGHHSMIFITAETSGTIVGAYIFGITSMILQTYTSTSDTRA